MQSIAPATSSAPSHKGVEFSRPSKSKRRWLPATADAMRRFFYDETGQDTFEYILVAGTFAIAVVAVLIVAFGLIIPQFAGTVCPEVDPLASINAGDCLGN
jgi:Flp pilus assembly pilin Flp